MELMADRHRAEDPVRITTARRSPSVDTAARQRRYLISMAIRTLCVLGAVAIGEGWVRWVLIAAAVALPQIAVVAANTVDRRGDGADLLDQAPLGRALPAGSTDDG